jgi:transcriptional regulator with XRE-family HTH domain
MNEITLGEKIKRRRKERKLSQIALAKLAGVSSPWITKIERGSLPSLPVVLNIVRALEDPEEEYVTLFREAKSKKELDLAKKRQLVYHSPLSGDDIEEIVNINKLFEEEVIKKRRLEEIGLAAAGPVRLDIKTKIEILKQLKILKSKKPKR